MIILSFVLVLIYSPASPYFNGFTFEIRDDRNTCLNEIERRVGEKAPLKNWETQFMGPIPTVIGGFCAEGGFAPGAK